MNFKKRLLVFCLILFILFSISSAYASDIDDTAIVSDAIDEGINDEIMQDDITDNEDLEDFTSDNNAELILEDDEPAIIETELELGESKKSILSSSTTKTFADIQKMVNNAKAGDTISLSGTYIGKGTHIKITKSLTVEGNGATLDAKGLSKMFEITGTNVKINNINFKNGNSLCGGAIDWWSGGRSNQPSNGILTNCNFYNCYAENYGGAVYFCDNSLTMYNCKFTGNTAYKGGAVYVSGSDCIIESCKFYSNHVYVSPGNLIRAIGAAICCDAKGLVIDNCVLEGNDVKGTLAYDYQTFDGDDIDIVGMGIGIIKNDENPTQVFISNTAFKNAITIYLFESNNPNKLDKYQYSDNIYCDNSFYLANDSCSYQHYTLGGFGIHKNFVNVKLIKTSISVPKIIYQKGKAKTIVASIKGKNGYVFTQGKVLFCINGKYYIAKVKSGKAQISVKIAASKKTIKCFARYIPGFYSKDFYDSSIAKFDAVMKSKPKITAKKKSFKLKVKTKKYQITLKNIGGKAIKKVKVSLKVKGKTYKTKTNSKGKATFKIKNLKKIGKYTAVIKFAGNKYYYKVSKKAKITVK